MPDPIINRSAPRTIPVACPDLTEAEALAAYRTVKSSWISQGPRVEAFERAIAAAHGKRFGIACCSGTSALMLALQALHIGPGDEVICPTFTMVAVPNAIMYRGAIPVFVDSQWAPVNGSFETGDGNGNASLDMIVRCVTPRTKAIIAVHTYGEPLDVPMLAVNVPIIEDCAEAHYATFNDGRPVGSIGVAACFSFFSNKICAAGEGGVVAANLDWLNERLRSLRSHAFTPGQHFTHQELAYGFRMPDIVAAVGLVQHERRTELLAIRRTLEWQYRDRFSRGAGSSYGIELTKRSAGSVPWVMPILARDEVQRDKVRWKLADVGVETRTYFVPGSRQAHLRQFAVGRTFPAAESLAARGLYLPLHTKMTEEDVDYVCNSL